MQSTIQWHLVGFSSLRIFYLYLHCDSVPRCSRDMITYLVLSAFTTRAPSKNQYLAFALWKRYGLQGANRGNGPLKPRCKALCRGLHGTSVTLAMPLTISSKHQAASRYTNTFHPYGALQMANVISPLLVGPKMESATCRSKKSVKHRNFDLQRHLLKLSHQRVSQSSKPPQVGGNPSKLTDVEHSTTQRAEPAIMTV